MFQFPFLKSVHCHHAVAEATKGNLVDRAAEAAEAIKATVLQLQDQVLAVRQAVALVQAQAAVVKADLVDPAEQAEGVQDALAVTNLNN